MLEIETAGLQKIQDSRDEWNHLAMSMELPSVFLTWDWITTWITHFGKEYKIIILFVYDERKLVAILPLAKKKIKFANSLFWLDVITICGSIELYPDHLDLIYSKDSDVNVIIDLIFRYIKQYSWDVLYFPFLSEKGSLSSYLKVNNKFKNCWIKTDTLSAPYIKNEKDFASFLKKIKGKKRYNLKRERKKLFNVPGVYVDIIDSGIQHEELAKYSHELFRLHELRTNKKGIVSTFIGESFYKFHSDIIHTFHQNDWLRLYFIRHENNPVAVGYGFVFAGRYSYYQSGMDPEWEYLSPGKLLIFEIIKHEFDRGVLEFDFLGGEDAYKKFWTKQVRNLISYHVYKKNIPGTIEFFYQKFRGAVKQLFYTLKFITTN